MSREEELLQRIAELEQENWRLRSCLAPVESLPAAWGLTRAENGLLIAIAKAPECLSKDQARIAIRGRTRSPSDASVDGILYRLRLKVAARGIEIRTLYAMGWAMPSESRAIVLDALATGAARRAA